MQSSMTYLLPSNFPSWPPLLDVLFSLFCKLLPNELYVCQQHQTLQSKQTFLYKSKISKPLKEKRNAWDSNLNGKKNQQYKNTFTLLIQKLSSNQIKTSISHFSYIAKSTLGLNSKWFNLIECCIELNLFVSICSST